MVKVDDITKSSKIYDIDDLKLMVPDLVSINTETRGMGYTNTTITIFDKNLYNYVNNSKDKILKKYKGFYDTVSLEYGDDMKKLALNNYDLKMLKFQLKLAEDNVKDIKAQIKEKEKRLKNTENIFKSFFGFFKADQQ